MKRLSILVAILSLFVVGATLSPNSAIGQDRQASDIARINAAGQAFIAAIGARDIEAMDKLWAHESYATFIGPLSTTVVVGWDGVRKAWQMRFGQFDRVTISLTESHVRTNGNAAWVVGLEKVELLRKDGRTLSFEAFVSRCSSPPSSGRAAPASRHKPVILRAAA
jgi:ketosteroid isomerase-like protein